MQIQGIRHFQSENFKYSYDQNQAEVCRALTGPCTRTMTATSRAASMATLAAISVQLLRKSPQPPNAILATISLSENKTWTILLQTSLKPEQNLPIIFSRYISGIVQRWGRNTVSSVILRSFATAVIPWPKSRGVWKRTTPFVMSYHLDVERRGHAEAPCHFMNWKKWN